MSYRLEQRQRLARPREEVFAFFTDAGNLARLTPEFVGFRLLTPLPAPFVPGTLLDYQLRLLGVPVRWRSRIELVEAPRCFVDVQVRGPYRHWRHEHRFETVAGGTEVIDRVDYALPLGPLGALAHALAVRPMLARIFAYRRSRLVDLLGPELPGPAR
jgi:hypothetical protein